ncbi:TolC family protein [Mucilaginibacter sp. BJC16-A38]|uniref:TolC family protein n=1 Tax=Mucilaginibacter phenanthrenivorans TaxID=1234842 RepID=UPI0021586AB2|nr:TolC family protein [Mucilaginibacter phenanthrenivorans]MCR8558641.1 TolC family protein [Mucilaginibacter phenanthrenivorans]
MMIKKLGCLVFCLIALTLSVSAQTDTVLTLKDAVEIALKNNYHILLTKNNNSIAQNNVTIGNAGFLPQVTGNFTTTRSIQNTRQTKSDGTETDLHGAHNATTSYGPNLNWTIFNGFGMFANYDELKQLNQLSDVRSRDTIQNTLASVIDTYYNLINQNEQLKALQGAIVISRTQLRYAKDKLQVGRASGLDVLNAQVNLNTDTANYLNQLQQFKSAKIQMNQLLVRNLQTDFSVGDTIVVDDRLVLGDILTKAESQNPAILSAQINKRISEINLKQVRASRYPQVSVNSGYVITNSQTPAGFTTSQNNKGFNYGLTASINIFNGFNQNRMERNARIGIDNAAINYKQTTLDVQAQVSNLYVSYLSGLDLIKLGQSNVEVAKKNLEISLEKYKLGNITPLEIREAQRNYLDAQSKFFAAQYQSKSAEIMLKEITASINIQ